MENVSKLTELMEDYKSNSTKLLKISELLLQESIKDKEYSFELARNIACIYYKIPVSSFELKNRQGLITSARQLASVISTLLFDIDTNEVAKLISLDRTTIYASCQRFFDDYDTNKFFRMNMDTLIGKEKLNEMSQKLKSKHRL